MVKNGHDCFMGKTYKRKNGKGSAKARDFKKGGKVRGAGIARKGVRPAKMR